MENADVLTTGEQEGLHKVLDFMGMEYLLKQDVRRLLATLDAYRAVLVDVAAAEDERAGGGFEGDGCKLCLSATSDYYHIQHTADCPVTRARALLNMEQGEQP